MPPPTFESLVAHRSDIENLKLSSQQAAYNLLVKLEQISNVNGKWKPHQIATSESLTAGLIMSTIVDIPWCRWAKYGCTGVYDTDAKRVFNGVAIDDVYTQRCAKEMAIGLLKNSNATIALAVTGNAMPDPKEVKKLGEVFIGVAGYSAENEIVYQTKSINSCIESRGDYPVFEFLCKRWFDDMKETRNNPTAPFPDRRDTAVISQEIRYYTATRAMEFCLEFLNKNRGRNNLLISPKFIKDRKRENNTISKRKGECHHPNIPANKYDNELNTICVGEDLDCQAALKCKSNKAKYEIKSTNGPMRRRTQNRTPTSNNVNSVRFPKNSFTRNSTSLNSIPFPGNNVKSSSSSSSPGGDGIALRVNTPLNKGSGKVTRKNMAEMLARTNSKKRKSSSA